MEGQTPGGGTQWGGGQGCPLLGMLPALALVESSPRCYPPVGNFVGALGMS